MARHARYLEVAEALCTRWSGLPPGSLVESEHDVAAEFDINRLTAREAIRELERRMLVRREVGRGTFTAHRLNYVVEIGGVPSFHRNVAALGYQAQTRVVGSRRDDATGVLVVERESSVDGFRATAASEHFPADVAELVDGRLVDGVSVHDLLVEVGFAPRRLSVTVSLRIPPAAVAERLGFHGAPHPTWLVESVTCNVETGSMIHRSASWMRADVFAVTMRIDDGT